MKSNSHRTLGHYLANMYMQDYSSFCRRAFSIGCVQPDKNPTTYLKGSLRWQWLRGHNWDNAKSYIRRSGDRLQECKTLNAWECYRLGKLIHYTADAFTYAHNKHYSDDLSAHRDYEKVLHERLEKYLSQLKDDFRITMDTTYSVSDFINTNHARYMHHNPCHDNDMHYCVKMCSQVLQLLLQGKQLVRI